MENKIKQTSKSEISKRICLGENIGHILLDMKIGVYNYNDYFERINEIDKDVNYLNQATLEECLLYLTYLWRSDYHSGGYPYSDYMHSAGVRLAKMRVVDLFFEE